MKAQPSVVDLVGLVHKRANHSENQSLLFFNYINSRHPNISFTVEKEIDHRILFLDVLINNDTHYTSVYRKKTFTFN